ncbi:hypothetical protein ZWY2020_006659 [Hordeum vulgare]|nr:hypothetical protein ZWY2020_006659 [Hordeum vulgare]
MRGDDGGEEEEAAAAAPLLVPRVALYGINVVSQAFIGHIGDLELAAFSIASTVIAGFNFGFLLGMASALETLCGQAFGAKKHHMLGVYLQRSWIVLFLFALALTPTYVFTEDLLLLLGQAPELSCLAGKMSLKNWVTAATAGVTLALHVLVTYLLVTRFQLGYAGVVVAADVAWWVVVLGQFLYVVCGGCPLSWRGFSVEAFADFWDFIKLPPHPASCSAWRTGTTKCLCCLRTATSICRKCSVRVANELGAGSGKGALLHCRSITTSVVIGLVFWCLILTYNDQIALLFSSGKAVLDAVHNLAMLLAFTILLNSVQPVLSGGYWFWMASIGRLCQHRILLPGRGADRGHTGLATRIRSSGNLVWVDYGTAVQTLVLVYLTMRCDWDDEAKTTSARMRKWASTK